MMPVNKTVDNVDKCIVCGCVLTKEEVFYYGRSCNSCEEKITDSVRTGKEFKTLIIPGTFPSLNQYIAAMNRNRHIGNKVKQDETERVQWLATQIKQKFEKVHITFRWYEKNRKRDLDNVAFAKKFILDGLVKAGVIPNDGWKNVVGFEDKFYIDKDNPRVVVEILEV